MTNNYFLKLYKMKTQKNQRIFSWKRAIFGGILLYASFFLIASILIYLFQVDDYLIPALFIIPFAVYIFSRFFYFRRKEHGRALKKGVLLGLFWLATTILLDIVFVVYGVDAGWDFFLKANWTLAVLYLEIIVFSSLGALKKERLLYEKSQLEMEKQNGRNQLKRYLTKR